jgi:tRNA A64-2'-O-ribosylphosphate transferase
LQTIYTDAEFVKEVKELYPALPLYANLRCGLWYSPAFEGTCYFKSTDGHINKWHFNCRRANLQLLPLVLDRTGVLIVDATRRGRSIPDSFSKTIPIWACVINRAVARLRAAGAGAGEGGAGAGAGAAAAATAVAWDTTLHTPPRVVLDDERAQIESRLEGMVTTLIDSAADLTHALLLTKPLRPLWITPHSKLHETADLMPEMSLLPFHPLVCISASEPIDVQQRQGFIYLQGCVRCSFSTEI